jgi:organic hydroperoxide reductase OsmC/OhrA
MKSENKKHNYKTRINWTGNSGQGTSDYTSYERSYQIMVDNKPILEGTADTQFRGDKNKYNPEELFLASISSCHMLWYLHLCSVNKIVVLDYQDNATGVMVEQKDGSGKFEEVRLNPIVLVEKPSMIKRAEELHADANKMCFIANSCNFKIDHDFDIQSKG